MNNLNIKNENPILANIVFFIHLVLVIIIIFIPFSNSNCYLLYFIIFIPFIILHWLSNNDTCVLTLLEKKLRNANTKEKEQECFTQKIISPVFTFTNDYKKYSLLSYSILIFLWTLVFSKLLFKYTSGYINNIYDLLEI